LAIVKHKRKGVSYLPKYPYLFLKEFVIAAEIVQVLLNQLK